MITEPKINSANITPNPVNAGQQYKIAIGVIEVEVILYSISPYSGTHTSGQTLIMPPSTVQNN